MKVSKPKMKTPIKRTFLGAPAEEILTSEKHTGSFNLWGWLKTINPKAPEFQVQGFVSPRRGPKAMS
jgi:hypothetical protein